MFLSAWVGLAVALPRSRRWWVAAPMVLAGALWFAGAPEAVAVAFYLSPLAAIAVALIAGWTRALRPNAALGAVTASFVVAEAGLIAQTSDGGSGLDGFTGFAVLVLTVAAIAWALGSSAHELVLRRRSRDQARRGPRISPVAGPRRPVLPPPPRH